MSLSIGIVGLPNVGKSTLFTALTNKGGLAANYPFATIEPNVGVVPVPDARLDALAAIDDPARIVPATVEFVDIAGLVAGASQGEGLGNQFLANIRETDAICEVVRFFGDPDVVHVSGRVDPLSDVETIKTELILADLATLEKAIPRLEKEAKRDKAGAKKLEVAKKVFEGLNEGHRARTLGLDAEEQEALYDLHLLTMKPMLYIANVDEDHLDADLPEIDGCAPVPISAKVEADLAELDPAEAKEYLEAMGLEESGLARLVREAYRLLGLQSLLHERRDRDACLDHPHRGEGPPGRRRHPHRLRAWVHQGRDGLVRRLRGAGRREGLPRRRPPAPGGQGIRRAGRGRHALQVQRVGGAARRPSFPTQRRLMLVIGVFPGEARSRTISSTVDQSVALAGAVLGLRRGEDAAPYQVGNVFAHGWSGAVQGAHEVSHADRFPSGGNLDDGVLDALRVCAQRRRDCVSGRLRVG